MARKEFRDDLEVFAHRRAPLVRQLGGRFQQLGRHRTKVARGILEALRALISSGWVLADLLPALGAVGGVGVVSFALAISALHERVRRA